jgi:hypothetical protein
MEKSTIQDPAISSLSEAPVDPPEPRPWEMIENGRYQPRRIRGSCLGRELG